MGGVGSVVGWARGVSLEGAWAAAAFHHTVGVSTIGRTGSFAIHPAPRALGYHDNMTRYRDELGALRARCAASEEQLREVEQQLLTAHSVTDELRALCDEKDARIEQLRLALRTVHANRPAAELGERALADAAPDRRAIPTETEGDALFNDLFDDDDDAQHG